MNLFESVKSSITTREAAEHYGIHVGRSGMCRCPFHNDRTPSMKADERFHCFGCQADGDVISFTSRLFDLSPKDAALKLASDFGIAYDEHLPLYIVRKHPEISKEERFQHQASYCFSELAAYRNQLVQWQEQYAPQSPDDDLHPRFLEALHHLDDVEYQLDVLQYGTDQERQEAVQEYMQNQTKPQEVTTMRKILSCEFNLDTACVELCLDDGTLLSIYCTAVENEVVNSMYQRSELDWLIYNDPLAYAELILNGDPEQYLKAVTAKSLFD